MFKHNKKKLLSLEHINNTPLLPSNSKGENYRLRIKEIKQNIRLRKIKDINGMQISYEIIKRKN